MTLPLLSVMRLAFAKAGNVKAAWLQQSCGEGDAQREHSLDE